MKLAVRDAAKTHPPRVGLLCFACYTTHHPSPHRAPCHYDFFRVRASDCVSDLWLSFAAFSDLTNDEHFRTPPCMEFSLVHMSACLITLVHSLPGADKGRPGAKSSPGPGPRPSSSKESTPMSRIGQPACGRPRTQRR